MENGIETKLKFLLGEVFDVCGEEIGDGTSPENVPLWDSLNHLKMVNAIEKSFNVKFSMKEVRSMENFGKVKEMVENHMEKVSQE